MVKPLTVAQMKDLNGLLEKWPFIEKDWLESLARSVIHAEAKPLAKLTQDQMDALEKFKAMGRAVDKLIAKAGQFTSVELQALALQRTNAALTVDIGLREIRAIFQACEDDLTRPTGRTAERRSILIKQIALYLAKKGITPDAEDTGPLVDISFTLLVLAGDIMKFREQTVRQVLIGMK